MEKKISRRDFMKGTAAGAASLVGAGILGGSLTASAGEAEAEKQEYKASSSFVIPTQSVTWDEEHDIVIVGYGLAGASAYVEAATIDPSVDVVVYDKSDYANRGGMTIASGQSVLFPEPSEANLELFRRYCRALWSPNCEEESLQWLTYEMAHDLEWIQGALELGGYEVGNGRSGGPIRYGSQLVEFPLLDGAEYHAAGGTFRPIDHPTSYQAGGCWYGMSRAAESLGCQPNYEHRVMSLVQDAVSKHIDGVAVQKPDGSMLYVKANKGVILATGGYENNLQMLRDFNGADTMYSAGSPYVTGDGVKMEAAVGARLWHMDNHTMPCGFFHGIKVPDYETCFVRQFYFNSGAWCEVAADSTRYYDEARTYQRQHMKYYEHGQYVDVPIARSQPVHIIFDDNCCKAQPMVNDWLGWPATCADAYVWSSDNSVEVEKGWIIKADTIEELAEKLGRDPEVLRATIDRFNEMVDKGVDEDFGRDISTMEKIEKAPFYAIEEFPALPACSGGGKRNTKGEVLNWDDEPIPGLYSAGELGSTVSNLYQNGTYLHEAVATGRAAVDTILGGRSVIKPVRNLSNAVAVWGNADDGEYRTFAHGLHDPYELIFEIKDHKLVDVRLGEGAENMFMPKEDFDAYVKGLIETQTNEVDAVSGATIDCQAIQQALYDVFGERRS